MPPGPPPSSVSGPEALEPMQVQVEEEDEEEEGEIRED